MGRAISRGLAEAGWNVVVNYNASEEAAREVVGLVNDGPGRAVAARGDVAEARDVAVVVEAARDAFGRLDLLVNNAAVFPEGDLLTLDEENWDRTLGVNLKGPWLMAREAAGLLREARGSMVNILDNSAFRPWPAHPHHSVSKAGLLHLTRLLARVLAPEVRVNAVSPGAVLLPEGSSEEERKQAVERAALKRTGSPEDVVRTVLFLADSPFVTGEVIVVDGGALLGRG